MQEELFYAMRFSESDQSINAAKTAINWSFSEERFFLLFDQILFKEEYPLVIQTHFNNGVATYFANEKGRISAQISMKDGKYSGFSIVPLIMDMQGNQSGLLFILDWVTKRAKSPILSDIKYPLLVDFGFQHADTGLVWDPSMDVEDVEQVVMFS